MFRCGGQRCAAAGSCCFAVLASGTSGSSPPASFCNRKLAMDRLEQLVSEREGLHSSLAATKQEIKQEKQKRKDQARSAKQKWQLTDWLKKVAMIIYMLAAFRAAPAIKFLELTARKRRWPQKSTEELQQLVEDLFMEVDVEWLAHASDLDEPEDPAATKEAIKHVEEWKLFEHVKDLNERLGLAPSTEQVLQKLEQNRLRIPPPLQPVPRGATAEVKARMWARRWRSRWGARHGSLGLVDDISLAEKQAKAVPFYDLGCFGFGFLGPESETVSGLRFRDQKWSRLLVNLKLS